MPPKDSNNRNPAAAKPYDPPQDDSSTLLPMLIAGLVMITVGYAVIMLFV